MIGRQISHFYVIRSLGAGGMGIVYEAQDTRLPRSVALKFLKPALSKNVDAVRRFKREARLASSLNHPNICTILDVDECEGQSFIAMELLQGRSLKERLASSPMSLGELLEMGIQVADALAEAHEQGIMHRDITPGNIFITAAGVVKLLDFGLAKQFAAMGDTEDLSDDLTQPGTVAGTVHYMAPEQFSGEAVPDHRCDLFSFGAVLYQAATGARPFEGKSKLDVIELIEQQPHIPLRRLAPQYPSQFERLVDRLLAKSPQDRYTAAELRQELRTLKSQRAGLGPNVAAGDTMRGRMSIAVLPFELIGSADAHTQQFKEGLAEDISMRLSRMDGVRVAARTSTRHVAGQTVREIGARLNVETVLEGSVQRTGPRVRVIATLIDAARERARGPALAVDREFDDLLDVQDEMAREIVEQVTASLAGSTDRWQTDDPQAQLAFKRGQHHWANRFTGGWEPALTEFQDAIDRDPRFALAHVAVASIYEFLGFYCLMKPVMAFREAQRSVDHALELDDTLAAAHTELALIRFGGNWDWEGSEQAFRRALQLDPTSFVAHIAYGWLLMLLGREEAALSEAKKGHDLHPTSRFAAAARAQALYLAKRYDEAIELCDQCLVGDPNYVFATSIRGQCYELKQMFPEAIADLRHTVTLTGEEPFYLGMLGHCYGKAGMYADALALLRRLEENPKQMYVPPQCYVYIYAGLGEPQKALQYQEKAYEDGASPFNYLVPSIRDLYALDPQHKRRLEQMRLNI